MRKVSILLVVALIATSCAVGTYHPYARNNFGAQSTVVLDKANFRVVRDVEAIVDVNNTNLSRADVASSAYGELLRKAQLTGSQVLINVVIEEVRRETAGFFRLFFGIPKRVQHVAARATIIEFLDENGKPTVSQPYRPTNITPIQERTQPTIKQSAEPQRIETTLKVETNTDDSNKVVTPIQKPKLVSKEEQKKLTQRHSQLIKLADNLRAQGTNVYGVFNIYNNIYHASKIKTEQVVSELQKIQTVLAIYLNSKTSAYPNLEHDLKNASSIEEQKTILLSYRK